MQKTDGPFSTVPIRRRRPSAPVLVALAAALVALAIPMAAPAATPAVKGAALAVLAIGLWATNVVPGHLTALLFFTCAMLFGLAPIEVVFSGFTSAALWLVFGGLVLGVAVKDTGLAARIATHLAGAFGSGYAGVIGGVVAIGVVLGFLMPSSMGRVVLILPIALALAERFGFGEGSRGRTGIVLAAAFGCHVPQFAVLPSNVPNLVLLGAAEALYGVTPLYGEYLLLHFPVLGLLKSLAIVALIVLFYPDRARAAPAAAVGAAGRMSRDERRLALLLALALGFWASDFAHGISPAWIGLGAAVVCLLPGVRLVGEKAFNQGINYGSLFHVAGIMGLGAVVGHSGLGAALADAVLAVLPLEPGAAVANFTSLTVLATVIAMATTLPGVPAVLTPLAGQMAEAAGLPVATVLMTQVLGFSTILFPYQSAPLVVAMHLGGLGLAPAGKVLLALAAVTIVVLLPLDFLWWRLLGVI